MQIQKLQHLYIIACVGAPNYSLRSCLLCPHPPPLPLRNLHRSARSVAPVARIVRGDARLPRGGRRPLVPGTKAKKYLPRVPAVFASDVEASAGRIRGVHQVENVGNILKQRLRLNLTSPAQRAL